MRDINPTFRFLLGNPQFDVRDHLEKVVILVVLLSISPAIYVWFKSRMKRKPPTKAPPPELVNTK